MDCRGDREFRVTSSLEISETVVLLSMTGFGDARGQNERIVVSIEIRTVNSRYLKVMAKYPDVYASLESKIEKVIRQTIARGTVTVSVRVNRIGGGQQYRLDQDVLATYWQQLKDVAQKLDAPAAADIAQLLALPNAVAEAGLETIDAAADWPLIRKVLEESLEKLTTFRIEEGRSMQDDLQLNGRIIGEHLSNIETAAPGVVESYRDRLHDRVRELLQGSEASVDATDLIREVSIFAERCDINEEITRLRCHLEQFEAFMAEQTSQGRKLEFLSQEMFREVNTIGSKANNVEIAHSVVDMKAAVEKIREILQNVE